MLPTLLEVVRQLKTEQDNAQRWAERHFQTLEDGHFAAIAVNEEEFALFPYPEFSAMIYRGQNQYYEPCLSSLHRSGRQNKVERLIEIVRLAEFELLLANHPAQTVMLREHRSPHPGIRSFAFSSGLAKALHRRMASIARSLSEKSILAANS